MPYKLTLHVCPTCNREFTARALVKGRPRYCSRRCASVANHPPIDIAERFWPKVEKTDGCWIWRGNRMRLGYGMISGVRQRTTGERKILLAHRVAYTLLVGPIADGLVIDHLCGMPACVNPAHLEPVTQAVNIERARKATVCRRGLHQLKRGSGYCRPCRAEWIRQRAH